MSRVYRRVLLGVVAFSAVTLLLTSGIAQRGEDPRNSSPEFADAVNGANCIAHHEADGLRPMSFSVVTRYAELPIGEDVDIEVLIRHNSDLTQDLEDLAVTLNTEAAPNVQVLTDEFVPEVHNEFLESLAPNGDFEQTIDVLTGAASFTLSVVPEGEPSAVNQASGQVDVAIIAADGTRFAGQGSAYEKSVSLDATALEAAGAGEYVIQVVHNHQFQQIGDAQEFRIEYTVEYEQTSTSFRFEFPGGAVRGADPGNLKSRNMTIPIRMTGPGTATLDFRFEAVNYWLHQPGDGAPRDDGLFYRFTTMIVEGGDSIVRVSATEGPVVLGPTVDLYNMFTRVLGYIAIVLVPVSMITGGMFGKASRRWLNGVTGGAKKRVLWHNAMSFMIIGIASLHFLLALVESKFVWTKGLLWGGVGWAVLISLGFTGWYQVRMIKRWNYKLWRHTHLWSAVGVFSFSLVHLVLDGSDMAFIRESLPGWHVKLIWP